MRVEWEIVSAVSGVVSAVVAVISLILLVRGGGKAPPVSGYAAKRTLLHYLLFCSAWVLLVIAYNWIFVPFGNYLSRESERKLYGVMIIVPALMLGSYALNRLGFVRARRRSESRGGAVRSWAGRTIESNDGK